MFTAIETTTTTPKKAREVSYTHLFPLFRKDYIKEIGG
jgi:hypothetical protein